MDVLAISFLSGYCWSPLWSNLLWCMGRSSVMKAAGWGRWPSATLTRPVYVLGGEAAAKQATGNFGCSCYTADSCSSWPSPCSWVSQLCWALDEVKVYCDFMQCAKRLGKLFVHPALLCPIRGTLLCQGLPSCF